MTKRITLTAISALALAALFAILYFCNVFTPSNQSKYDAKNCERRDTVLTGKTIYWLGSSVTLGMESGEQAVADYIAARNGTICVKEAVSGTTLIDKPFRGRDSYVTRLQNTNAFDKNAEIDAFVCQISTNDAKSENVPFWGKISPTSAIAREVFDLNTTLGSMEFIVSYVEEVWNCPVYFYSGSYISDEGLRASKDPSGRDYEKLIQKTKELAAKWNEIEGYEVKIIDLFHDEAFNAISDEDYRRYMHDPVHPFKAGYLEWWTPAFEAVFFKDF